MLAPSFLGLRVKGDDRIQGASCAHLGSPSSSLDLKNSSIGDDSRFVVMPDAPHGKAARPTGLTLDSDWPDNNFYHGPAPKRLRNSLAIDFSLHALAMSS